MKLFGGGGAVQTSTGFGITVDKQSVRHEQSVQAQTDHVRTGAYVPRKKVAPQTARQWQAGLVRDPAQVARTIVDLETALARVEGASAAPAKRPLSHRMGRALNWVASVPDAGNVKANRHKAVQLSSPSIRVPNVLRKARPGASPVATVDTAEVTAPAYASLGEHKQALTAIQKQHAVARLKQEAEQLRAALQDEHARAKASRMAEPEAYRAALHEIARNGGRGETVLAAAEARLTQVRQQGGMPQTLRDAQKRANAVSAAHANLVLPPLLDRLEPSIARLSEADLRDQRGASVARAGLARSQAGEIEQAIAALPGFIIGPGQQAAADALRARLREAARALLAQPFDPHAHAMPAPLLVDIFLAQLAATAQGRIDQVPLARGSALAPASASLAACLDPAFARRVLTGVRGLPGGVLAAEQISQQPVKDKEKRVALRVAALAAHALAQPPAPATSAPSAPSDNHARLLRAAAAAAESIANTGRRGACDEVQLAAYNAVRNGMLLDGAGDGMDHNLRQASERLAKFLGPWVERADQPRWRSGPLLNKTPFDPKSLRLANLTSSVGHDVAAQSMARLDKTLRQVGAQLDTCVAHLAPASLSASETVRLAATLHAADKARAHPAVRPGQVTLDRQDTAAVLAIVRNRLPALTRDAERHDLAAAAARLVAGADTRVGDALQIAPLVDAIAGHIRTPDAAALRAKNGLLKDAGIVRDMVSATQMEKITSLNDLYRFLEPKVQLLELRGKIKISSGGNVGGSTKLFSWPVSIANKMGLGLTVPVRGEIKANRARAAVFEIGMSTTSFDIFIGSEVRKGAGIGGGAGVRLGWEQVASSGGGIDKTVSQDQADTEGIWLRLPRNGDDERTRDEALAMLRTLFDMDGAQPAHAADDARLGASLRHDDGGDAMPQIVGRLLAQHPNLSLSVVDRYKEKTLRNEVAIHAAAINVKAGSGEAAARFALLNGGFKTERRDKRAQQSDRTGFMQITRSNALSAGNAFGQAGLVSIGAGFGMDGNASAAPTLGNGFTYARQVAQQGVDTKLRFITRDGETNVGDSELEYENLDFNDHMRRIDLDRRAWLEAGVRELFKPDPEAAAAPPPLAEQMRVAEQWLSTLLGEAHDQSNGNARHVYALSYGMLHTVAATVDGLRAKAALARRGGAEAVARRIDLQVDDLLRHPAAWRPKKITASERTSEREQSGANLGLVFGASTTAEGQRGTISYPK